MNTKTNAPAEVAQLDKGADKSPKQAAVQTVQAQKPADHAAPANSKGNQAMAKTEFDDKRYAELHAKSATDLGLDDAEHDEYVKLMGLRRAGVAAKRKELETLVESFNKSDVTFADFYKAVIAKNDGKRAEITSLFSPEEIKAAAPRSGTSSSAKNKPAAVSLIAVPKADKNQRGRQTTYVKGDLKKPNKPAFKALYEKDPKNFAKALETMFTSAGKEYFATDAGKKELTDFIAKYAPSK